MAHPTPKNSYERELLENIRQFGWQATFVAGSRGSPSFAYTIGLHGSYAHPELIVIGLPREVAHDAFAAVAQSAASDRPIDFSRTSSEVLPGYTCAFVSVPRAKYGDYVLSALWWEQGDSFALYQLVWPSADGLFPWDARASEQFRREQPVLGSPSAPR